MEVCAHCGHERYVSPDVPREPKFETHQVATIGDVKVNICYGGCLYGPDAPNYHEWAREEPPSG